MKENMVDILQEKLVLAENVNEKISLLRDLSFQFLSVEPMRARDHAKEALALAHTAGDTALIALCAHRLGDCYRSLSKNDIALRYLTKAARLFEELPDDPKRKAMVYRSIGAIHHAQCEFEKALAMYDRALQASCRGGDRQRTAMTLCSVGDTHVLLGDYTKALDAQLQSLSIWESLGDRGWQAIVLNELGIIYGELDDSGRALELLLASLDICVETKNAELETMVLGNVGHVYAMRGDFDAALDYQFMALELYEKLGQRQSEGITLSNIAASYASKGNHELALEYLARSLEIFDDTGDAASRADALIEAARIHSMTRSFAAAVPVLTEALELTRSINYRRSECEVHRLLALAYEQLGELSCSLAHYKSHMTMRAELEGIERAAVRIEMRADIERAEREKDEYRRTIERLEREMEDKGRELAAMALHLAQKNELVSSLGEDIASLGREGEERSDAAQSLLRKLRESADAESEWQVFDRQFREAHPTFARIMVERYPTLTAAELRVCSLLMINLTTKEIASLLRTSVRTVEGHRNHIRRKIALPPSTPLPVFLASLR